MKLSRTSAYAIHALVYIAGRATKAPVIGHSVAQELGIPESFLLRVLVALANSHILASIKGPTGGYLLGRKPRDVSLLAIIEAVEGPLAPRIKTTGGKQKQLDEKLEKVVQAVTEEVRRQLAAVTLADLAGSKAAKARKQHA